MYSLCTYWVRYMDVLMSMFVFVFFDLKRLADGYYLVLLSSAESTLANKGNLLSVYHYSIHCHKHVLHPVSNMCYIEVPLR